MHYLLIDGTTISNQTEHNKYHILGLQLRLRSANVPVDFAKLGKFARRTGQTTQLGKFTRDVRQASRWVNFARRSLH